MRRGIILLFCLTSSLAATPISNEADRRYRPQDTEARELYLSGQCEALKYIIENIDFLDQDILEEAIYLNTRHGYFDYLRREIILKDLAADWELVLLDYTRIIQEVEGNGSYIH